MHQWVLLGPVYGQFYPKTTGLYGHNQQQNRWRNFPILSDAVTTEHFRDHGYKYM